MNFLGKTCSYISNDPCSECLSGFKLMDYSLNPYLKLGDQNYNKPKFCLQHNPNNKLEAFYYNETSPKYERCPIKNCRYCSSFSTCEECQNEILNNNTLLYPYNNGTEIICSECLEENGFYVGSENKCFKCPKGCLKCSSESECLMCDQGFFFKSETEKICVNLCELGYYLEPELKQHCIPCNSSCIFKFLNSLLNR